MNYDLGDGNILAHISNVQLENVTDIPLIPTNNNVTANNNIFKRDDGDNRCTTFCVGRFGAINVKVIIYLYHVSTVLLVLLLI